MVTFTETDKLHARALGIDLQHCSACAQAREMDSLQRMHIGKLTEELSAGLRREAMLADQIEGLKSGHHVRNLAIAALSAVSSLALMADAGWLR